MFTGIIEEVGQIRAIVYGAKSVKITISAEKILIDLHVGDSIAVSGVCLTVTSYTKSTFTADVMPETVNRTLLSKLKCGDMVNLERALTLATRLGGHMVSGHVDGLGEIIEIVKDDNALVIKISLSEDLLKYVIEKGSIAVDGISLTVVACAKNWCSVSMIPHTAASTTLGTKKVGAPVNIENDLIGKYIERFLLFQSPAVEQKTKNKITLDFLNQNGF